MSRCPTFNFQVSIMSKWIAKRISNKVSFKISIRKRHVYIDFRWAWKWNQYFYFGIRNDERTEIVFLPSFQLVTRLNSQNRNVTVFINVPCHITLYLNIGNSNWHYWSFDSTNMMFFTLFQFLTRFPTSNYLNLFSTYLEERKGSMWKTCFSAPQNAKKENQLKHKNLLHIILLLTVRSSRMKDYSCHYEVSS